MPGPREAGPGETAQCPREGAGDGGAGAAGGNVESLAAGAGGGGLGAGGVHEPPASGEQ